MRARWTTAIALTATALLLALPLGAQETEDLDPADRALVHAYSGEAMQLLWAAVLGDAETAALECGIDEEGTYTYEVDEEGNVTITPDGGTETTQTEGCQFHETDVRGPQGQVNHGTVVSNFVHALAEAGHEGGRGCYVKIIAGSDYGKGEDQVRVPDVETDNGDDGGDDGLSLEDVDFTITETTCQGDEGEEAEDGPSAQRNENGKGNGKAKGTSEGSGNGKPSWAGPPEHAQGKGR